MNYDDAITEVFTGARMRHDGFQSGIYVEHIFGRGLLKCWPVDCPSEEPNRTQCDFRATDADFVADWYELPAPVHRPVTQPPGNPVPVVKAGWGAPLDPKVLALARVNAGSWGKPAAVTAPPQPKPEPLEFCGECDFIKSACVCAPKKEPNKWGI